MIEPTPCRTQNPASRRRRAHDVGGEVVEFVKTYAKQETVGPLRGAGRWIAFGAAGAICLGLGLSLLLLGLLRLLQAEWIGPTVALVAAVPDRVGRVRAARRGAAAGQQDVPQQGRQAMSPTMAPTTTTKISPADLSQAAGVPGRRAGQGRRQEEPVAAGGGLLLLIIFFLLGKRTGKKRAPRRDQAHLMAVGCGRWRCPSAASVGRHPAQGDLGRLFGQSTFWKVVAVWVFGKASIKKFFGKNVESHRPARLGKGRYMQLATAEPVTKRERRSSARRAWSRRRSRNTRPSARSGRSPGRAIVERAPARRDLRALIVKLRQPEAGDRVAGGRTVNQLLDELEMNRESFLVIRNGTLVPGDGGSTTTTRSRSDPSSPEAEFTSGRDNSPSKEGGAMNH